MATTLAIRGGTPVRTAGWPSWPENTAEEWQARIEPALRDVYLSATEGLPGPRASEFASRFAAYCGAGYGVLTPHGTDALMAALTGALDIDGIGESGEAIVPNYTFIATASAALDRRLSLRFVDIDPDTFTILPEAVDYAAGASNSRVVIPVHMGGQPTDMDGLGRVASARGLKIVEDCAQAHGAEWRGRKVGSLGDAGAFSFQSSKNLTSGEGGMVTTNDVDVRDRVAAFMDVGRRPGGARWEYPRLGWNYRPSEYIAALLDARLGDLEPRSKVRTSGAEYLTTALGHIKGITPPRLASGATRHAYHLYMMQYDPEGFGGHTRDEFIAALHAEGISCTVGYTQPLSEEPAIQSLREKYPNLITVDPCPNVERVASRSVWLTQNVLLAEHSDLDDIVEATAKIRRAFLDDVTPVTG